MKAVFVFVLFILSTACSEPENSSSTEGLLEESVQNENDETVIDQQQMLGPNEIMLKIKVLGSSTQDKEICGLSKEHVFHVEVTEILQSGSSINQKLTKEQQMDVAFLFDPEVLETGTSLEVKAKEGLCPDTSTSYFTIIEHKILE
ncbi:MULTISPECIES: hypothetical protein [Flavobacteriaceae]|uniref:hypothetical protein n=1 Tax=Flavobacteriaceae TaxID=49546 RepID=UPI00149130DA|nr:MULTISPECIES: hypothetical protein [Allomuricauda]MDC6365293.1 hypothetical protein [Muricauda sp. AC10]